MSYVYIKNITTDLYDIGFFTPDGVWQHSGYSYTNKEVAAQKVHYLNGGNLNNTEFAALLLGFEDWGRKCG